MWLITGVTGLLQEYTSISIFVETL